MGLSEQLIKSRIVALPLKLRYSLNLSDFVVSISIEPSHQNYEILLL